MLALKILLKTAFHLLRKATGRQFLYFATRFGSRKRYQQFSLKWRGKTLQIPDALSFIWQHHEIFVQESYRFACPKPAPLIYDCGANIGLSVLYFKQLYPQAVIKAFEASPDIAQILTQNIERQDLKNVEIQAAAIWTNYEGLDLHLESADASSLHGEGERSRVPSLRLHDLLEKEVEVDFLKMDIEGAEVEVLLDCGDALRKVAQLFVEYHDYKAKPQRLPELLALLSAQGFRYFIQTESERQQPFINRSPKNSSNMDLQLNIFAYRL